MFKRSVVYITNYEQWYEICKEFCKQKRFKLLFVNSDNFGFEDKEERLHHVYAEELVNWL